MKKSDSLVKAVADAIREEIKASERSISKKIDATIVRLDDHEERIKSLEKEQKYHKPRN